MFTARIESVYANHSYASNLASSDLTSLNSVLYSYFGNTVSTDKFDSLLRRYGIIPSGVVDHDVQALYNAMHGSAANKINSTLSQNKPVDESSNMRTVPWADVMGQIGLVASGEIGEDQSRFYSKISEMRQSGASSAAQQAYLNQLLAQAGIVFVESPVQEKSQMQTANGAQIAALMNKQFFFGGSVSA